MLRLFTVHVEFPALTELLNFLKAGDASQEIVDAFTASVNGLTDRLKQSNTALKNAVESNPGE